MMWNAHISHIQSEILLGHSNTQSDQRSKTEHPLAMSGEQWEGAPHGIKMENHKIICMMK